MEGEPDLSAPPAAESKFFNPNLSRPININPDSINLGRSFNTTSTSTYTTSSSTSSPPDLVRHVQAPFKRHRPVGMMQSNGIGPKRLLVPQRETLKKLNIKPHLVLDAKISEEDISHDHRLRGSISQSKNMLSVAGANPEDATITPPSQWGSTVNTHEQNFKPDNNPRGLSTKSGNNETVASSSGLEHGHAPTAEVPKKVHFATKSNVISHEMEWDVGNQVDTSAAVYQNWQHHDY